MTKTALQFRHNGRVLFRYIFAEVFRPRSGANAPGFIQVFERQRDTMQSPTVIATPDLSLRLASAL